MLNNVPPCNFQGFIVDVLLCIWNCCLKAFSKLKVTDNQNVIFRNLVPFQGQLLKIFIVIFYYYFATHNELQAE